MYKLNGTPDYSELRPMRALVYHASIDTSYHQPTSINDSLASVPGFRFTARPALRLSKVLAASEGFEENPRWLEALQGSRPGRCWHCTPAGGLEDTLLLGESKVLVLKLG